MAVGRTPETTGDLRGLLARLEPSVQAGRWVFVTLTVPAGGVRPLATFAEAEGLSAILAQPDADGLGLPYRGVWARVELGTLSQLSAVGLTAAVTAALSEADLPCNVVAAHRRDHLFVPIDRADAAIAALRGLRDRHR